MITAHIVIQDYENDTEEKLRVPGKYIICERCRGTGGHDPEAFSNGFTQEEMDEDPDFREDYMAGKYDVSCECCNGTGKQIVPDMQQLSYALKRKWVVALRQERQRARWAAADAATYRMESGGGW